MMQVKQRGGSVVTQLTAGLGECDYNLRAAAEGLCSAAQASGITDFVELKKTIAELRCMPEFRQLYGLA